MTPLPATHGPSRPDTAKTMKLLLLPLTGILLVSPVAGGNMSATPPFSWVFATAYHILPETHRYESGYFSLVDGIDGRMYVGTADYGRNAYLVEFDPQTETQRVVVDTNTLCGLDATGYAAQSKIHTRNFRGLSGKIYCGSMRGEKQPGETTRYPGGYVMVYDPAQQRAVHLGMPMPGMDVIDVVADEDGGLVYAVLKPEGHWMVRSGNDPWRELGPKALYYGQTLIDRRRRAHIITRDGFRLATYDPASRRVTTRTITAHESLREQHIPNWRLAPDGRTAYLLGGRGDATLWALDLENDSDPLVARPLARLVEDDDPQCNSGMDVGPDGRVYAVIRVDNPTGFVGRPHSKSHFVEKRWVHRLVRYDPAVGRVEDLGVVAIANPDFINLDLRPHCHGYQTFPNGTVAPKDHHFSLKVNRDGEIYITTIYPFALLRIKTPWAGPTTPPK